MLFSSCQVLKEAECDPTNPVRPASAIREKFRRKVSKNDDKQSETPESSWARGRMPLPLLPTVVNRR